jgi:hypothetical protein
MVPRQNKSLRSQAYPLQGVALRVSSPRRLIGGPKRRLIGEQDDRDGGVPTALDRRGPMSIFIYLFIVALCYRFKNICKNII